MVETFSLGGFRFPMKLGMPVGSLIVINLIRNSSIRSRNSVGVYYDAVSVRTPFPAFSLFKNNLRLKRTKIGWD